MARLQKKKNTQKEKKTKKTSTLEEVNASEKSIDDSSKNLVKLDDIDNLVAKKAKSSTSVSQGDNIFAKSIRYFKEVSIELKKVVWPPKKQVIASTIVVIILVIIISVFLGLNDFVLSSLVKLILK